MSRQVNDSGAVAIDAVRRYCTALNRIRTRLLDAYPGLGDVRDLMAAARSTRSLPRQGKSSTGIEYSIHGAGCQMTDDQGHAVDVDLVDGAEAFDAWRIKLFLGDNLQAHPAVEELRAACSYLASLDELREVTAGHWYALPGR